MNNDLINGNNSAHQWKISFNPDPPKQAQEVIFSRKIKKLSCPVLIFNNTQIIQTQYQKDLGFFFDEKLNFVDDLRYIANIHWATM